MSHRNIGCSIKFQEGIGIRTHNLNNLEKTSNSKVFNVGKDAYRSFTKIYVVF